MTLLNTKNVDTTGNKFRQAFDTASAAYFNRFAMLSMVASSTFFDVADIIEDTPYYRHQAKKLLNKCKKWYETYWQRVRETYADRYALYLDYCNACVRVIEEDVRIFFFSIKSALDKNKSKDSDIKAQVLLAAEMIRVAATFHTEYWEQASKFTGVQNIGRPIWYADHQPLLRMYTEFTACICSQDDASVLDDDQNARTALRAILAKCENDEKLGLAAREAILQNAPHHPEYVDMVNKLDEQRKEKEFSDNKQKLKETLSKKYKVK